jgi:hypothetical protein
MSCDPRTPHRHHCAAPGCTATWRCCDPCCDPGLHLTCRVCDDQALADWLEAHGWSQPVLFDDVNPRLVAQTEEW